MKLFEAGLLFSMLVVAAQAQRPSPAARPPNADANLPIERVGVDDLLSVTVTDSPELTRTFRIPPDGNLRLPLLKQTIVAGGKFPIEIEKEIATALVDEHILVSPTVFVSVAEYRSRSVSVMGAVGYPTTLQALGQLTLLDALSQAGGLTAAAGPEILVTRPKRDQRDSTAPAVQKIAVKDLINSADPSVNIHLLGGEEIRVPEADKVYVVGNVKQPGAFPVRDNTNTTVLKVLALSQGLLPYSAKQAYVYRRVPGSSAQKEIPIELARIMTRKSPDIALEPNDILYIPDNKGRRLTLTTLDRIAGVGGQAASQALIWGRF